MNEYIVNKENKNRKYITYGHRLEKEKFNEIFNGKMIHINKPSGGLWCSPINSDWGWKDWCEAENYRETCLNTWTTFTLRLGTRILVIDTENDYEEVLNNYGIHDTSFYALFPDALYIDWVKLKEAGYDGVWLTENGNRKLHMYNNPSRHDIMGMYAWDCESLVLFSFDLLENIKYGDKLEE